MAERTPSEQLENAKVFFTRAEEVAVTGNYDYAIEMYLDGIRRAPDALKEGHLALRQVALLRIKKGGKKPGMLDKIKRSSKQKDPIEELINQEWLFAHDPDNVGYAEGFLKAATAAGVKNTAAWVADMVFEANISASKPSFATFMMLKESYRMAGDFEKAIRALHYAMKAKPSDLQLADELKNLSAEHAMKKGKYDQEGDFRQSIQNREGQEKLQAQNAVVKTDDYKVIALKAARETAEKNPTFTTISKLADALAEAGTEDSFNEALSILEAKFAQTQEFAYKRHSNELKIKNLQRLVRASRSAVEENPTDVQARTRYDKQMSELLKSELEHFKTCVEQYPTDGKMKYEYGIRLMRVKRFDDAIPMLQDAQKDPKYRFSAMDKMGLCFFYKGWFSDAADIFRQAIESYEIKDDATAKDLRYNLARSLEEQGQTEQALELYRKLAQLDFGYKDVRQRVDKLRAGSKPEQPTS
ncbi:MAG: hypothetical protein A2Y07_08425 [Planctomycetes bacterium GWF2_50_10]|nr:MAG: hypothetical protein A2Y07_08425 [Planctomycetes bacterium GWF2_50_10]